MRYARFSDELRHMEDVDEPVAPWTMPLLIRDRLEAFLPSWPGPSDVPAPGPGNSCEAHTAELKMIWLLSGVACILPIQVFPYKQSKKQELCWAWTAAPQQQRLCDRASW